MIQLIDANCRIGNGPVQREGAIETTAGLLSLMDDFHVEQALVYHAAARYSDPDLGNELLTEETKNEPRFSPQWALLPPLWDLHPAPEKLAAMMKDHGVRSVRLFPAQYGHSMKPYAAGALMEMLAACRLPVFIDFGQIGTWDAVYELCLDYPAITFVLCGAGYRCLRYLAPVMNACDNIYVETGTLLMHNGIPLFCRNVGAERLIFGSGIPDGSLAAAASQLLLSDISDEEKQLIGAGNVKRLLAEVRL